MVEKDTSVNIVIVAAKCLASLASGLSKDFAKYVKMVRLSVLILES